MSDVRDSDDEDTRRVLGGDASLPLFNPQPFMGLNSLALNGAMNGAVGVPPPAGPQFDWFRAALAASASASSNSSVIGQLPAGANAAAFSGLFFDPIALAAAAHAQAQVAAQAQAAAQAQVVAAQVQAQAQAASQQQQQQQPRNHPSREQSRSRTTPGQTLLSLIESYDWPSVSARLAAHPSDARAVLPQGRTALHFACERDAPAHVVRSILSAHPAACAAVGTSGMNPLHITCSSPHASVDVVRVLLGGCPDGPRAITSQSDVDGDMPLHAACRCGAPIDVLELLLRSDPDAVRERDKEGLTPLLRLWVRYVVILGAEAIDAVRNRADLTGELAEAWEKTELLLRVAYQGGLYDDGDGVEGNNAGGGGGGGAAEGTESDGRVQAGAPPRPFLLLHAAAAIDCPRHVVRIAAALRPEQLTLRDESSGGLTPLQVAARTQLYAVHDLTGDGYVDEDDDTWYNDVDATQNNPGGNWGGGQPAQDHQNPQSAEASTALQQPSVVAILLEAETTAARLPDPDGRLPLATAINAGKTWDEGGVREILDANPDAIMVPDPVTRLYPFMAAAVDLSDSGRGGSELCVCETIFELLQANPELVRLGVSGKCGGGGMNQTKPAHGVKWPSTPNSDKKLPAKVQAQLNGKIKNEDALVQKGQKTS